MSKIICDVCGTQYPESASQCPICGRIRASSPKTASDDFLMEGSEGEYRERVKGGRFSKSNVRRRTQAAPRYEAPQERPRTRTRDAYEEYDEVPARGRSDRGINILLFVVILALLAVSAYIFMKYFLPNLLPQETEPPTTAQVETTEPPTQEPTEFRIPCTALNVVDTEIVLEDEGQMYLLNVAVSPVDTTDQLVYTSSDETIVTVNEEGRLTAVGEGNAMVTVTCGDQVLECSVACIFVDATEPPETEAPTAAPTDPPLKDVKLAVKKTDVTFKVKGQQAPLQLNCDLKPNEVQWISEDESIIKVDENGLATAVGKGVTNVVVKYGDQEIKIIVRCNL